MQQAFGDYRDVLAYRRAAGQATKFPPLRIVENRLTPSAGLTAGESEHRLSGEWLLNARVGRAAGSRSSDGSGAISTPAPSQSTRDAGSPDLNGAAVGAAAPKGNL